MGGESLEASLTLARPGFQLSIVLNCAPGVTALVGPSGVGKSTTLEGLAGLNDMCGTVKVGQQVWLDSERSVRLPVRRRRVGLVVQSLALFPHLTALQNVAFGSNAQQARVWLQRFRVEALAMRVPAELSGGEAQRVALARACAMRPALLLLDEPFSSLDADLRGALSEEVVAVVRELGVVCLLVTHDERDVERLAQHVVTIEAGATRRVR